MKTPIPSRRLIRYLLYGAPLFLLAGAGRVWLWAAIAYDAVLLVLAIGEAVFRCPIRDLRVARRLKEKLSLGEWNPVEILLRNDGRMPLRLHIRDAHPHEFSAEGAVMRLDLPALSLAETGYRVRPAGRGRFRFGALYVEAESTPGLVTWRTVIAAEREVKVYPNLIGLSRYRLMARHRRLAEFGFRPVRQLGSGREFESLRDYLPDDDYRHINWKATAKRAKPMTQVYEAERSQHVLIAIDASRIMAGRSGMMSRLDTAVNSALMLAHVASVFDDRVGVVLFSHKVEAFLPPRRGRHHFMKILDLLYAAEPRLTAVDYRALFRFLGVRLRHRALVVLLTDLLDAPTASDLAMGLNLMVPRHLPLCVVFRDPGVAGIARSVPSSEQDAFRKAAAQELLFERRKILGEIRRRGATAVESLPGDLTVSLVNSYLELKSRGAL